MIMRRTHSSGDLSCFALVEKIPRGLCVLLLADLNFPELDPAAVALEHDVPLAWLVLRCRRLGWLGFHICKLGLIGLQDRPAVEPDGDPWTRARHLDRVPLGADAAALAIGLL